MTFGLALLLASACGYGFEVLDTTDEEWVAPGYEVVEEAVIDPLEYGEPYTSNGTPTVGVHLSFVETGTGEAWRVVFVLDRKVVVLEEGAEPEEIPVDLDIASCAFSPSGRYVVVHDGAEVYTGLNAARIDTWTGVVEAFDSQPDGEPGPKGIQVSENGIVDCGYRFFGENLAMIGELNDPNVRWNRGTLSPSGRYFAVEKAWTSPTLISLFRTDGELLWENEAQPIAFASLVGDMVFSPDERFLAVPLRTGLEVWDVATGETAWRETSGLIARSGIQFSNDGSELIAGVMTWPDRVPGLVRHRIDLTGEPSVLLLRDLPEHCFIHPEAISSTVLVWVDYDQGGSRWILSNRSLDSLIWVSSVSVSRSPEYAMPYSYSLSRDGSRVCVCISGRVLTLSIQGDS